MGLAKTSGGKEHAFITGPDGVGMRDLGTLGGADSYALGINDAGQVLGRSRTAEGEYRAFITGPDGMGMREIGTLGGTYSYYSTASRINNAGQVVGYSSTPEGPDHAFITGPDGMGMRDLGTLGGDSSYANGINDAGQVSGTTHTLGLAPGHYDRYRGFIAGPDGEGMMDLNSLVDLPQGVILTNAGGINNNGQVIATGVPEPETYALLLAGLGLVGFMARRKKAEKSRMNHGLPLTV